ncbi:modifier of mdg4-like isoform X10 [Drosophila serrata]|uniref:modifier of mdg4-like isoform X10 n=1 Tax=Drosophila serrata TaxID=7274 RepID=UPI000A1D11BF|nr:modifier of mdg4-like isoform X10 [Drosophila serrata]
MADDEQFSLCWNNFNTNLSAGFHESLCRGDLVDVSLAAEGHIVKAHRLVLSVCSPFFRKMFTQMPSNTHAIVFLNNVSHSALKDLIQFMYCGEVNVKQDALPAFISTAESLQIKGLTDNDPAPQPPQEPSPPPPAAPNVQQQAPAQRVQRQQPRASARYKIETVDDGLGDDNKGTTQIVIQTTAAPQATIVQQPQQQQQQQQQASQIQTQQQLQTGTTTTATLVSTNKRSAPRSSLTTSSSSGVKRSKTSVSANVIDPLDSATETGTTTTTTQQLVPQQITVQTTVVSAAESKLHQQQQVRQQQQEEAEYIDLPMELPTKSEPDYSEDHGDAAGDGEGTYVEDDAYGDMRYDDSYFTENEDAGNQSAANTSGGGVTATTSKAVVKQNYSDSSFVDTSADQGNTEAQAFHIDFADSKKNGGKLLVINGFRFFRNKKRGHLQYWKCRNYYKERCPAIAIHDESSLILRLCHQHQHTESNDIMIKPLPQGGETKLSPPVEWASHEDDEPEEGETAARIRDREPVLRGPPPLTEIKPKLRNLDL